VPDQPLLDRSTTPQDPAKLRHRLLQRMSGILRRVRCPHVVDEPLGWHHLPNAQQQRNQQRTLPSAGHVDRVARALHHQRPQHLEPQWTPQGNANSQRRQSSAGALP